MGRHTTKRSGDSAAEPAGASQPIVAGSSAANPDGRSAETLHAIHSGQWMEAADLRGWAGDRLAADEPQAVLVLDVSGADHLDASALQVLLAIRAEQQRRGGVLQLVKPSEPLRRWFDYAGAADLLAECGQPAKAAKL